MRQTLHDYVIEQLRDGSSISWNEGVENALKFAKLTNRAPRLGDFVPCDEDGNVLEKPDIHSLDHSTAVAMHNEYQAAQDRVIFKGDWDVIDQGLGWTKIRSKELKIDVEWSDNECDVTVWDSNWNTCDYLSANRIEDLPLQIEFKEGVI